jgi:glycosyltransferase involved in cell wall biosynthesis
LNGADRIPAAIMSVRRQDYPSGLVELIVVDDGSTDETSAVARSLGARVVRHSTNRGIAAARNSGLTSSRATIVSYLDDDVIASPDWLSVLLSVFADDDVFAAGGKVLAQQTRRFSERYLSAAGYGNPAILSADGSGTIASRLKTYIRAMFHPVGGLASPAEVQAVYTSNVAYRKAPLVSIGGFDESLTANEDTDVSRRLRRAGGRIMFVPGAVIRHSHHATMATFIVQTFRRSSSTLLAYRRAELLPPVFPSPPIWLLLTVGVAKVSGYRSAMLAAAISPQLLYPWWPVSAARRREPERALYPYLQLAVETATILGLARGLGRAAVDR